MAAGDPGGTRIGSALIGGYSYIYRNLYDFAPLDNTARTFADYGVYKTGGGNLRAAIDAPFGAFLRDVEFYISATTSASIAVYLWRTQTGYVTTLTSTSVPGAGVGLRAVRLAIPDAYVGPYAPGSMIVTGVENTSTTVIVNGIRAGFSSAPAGAVMLATPTRVIDSRSTTKIGNGQTRIHDLSSRIPAGATSAILNVSITSGEKSGGVAVYNPGSTVPSGSAIYYNGSATISNELHVKLPSDRKIKITNRGVSGCKTHYFMDLVGYTA